MCPTTTRALYTKRIMYSYSCTLHTHTDTHMRMRQSLRTVISKLHLVQNYRFLTVEFSTPGRIKCRHQVGQHINNQSKVKKEKDSEEESHTSAYKWTKKGEVRLAGGKGGRLNRQLFKSYSHFTNPDSGRLCILQKTHTKALICTCKSTQMQSNVMTVRDNCSVSFVLSATIQGWDYYG